MPVDIVEVLSVEIDEDHARIKVKVFYGEGMSYMPSQNNYKVFMEKYGDEWVVIFTNKQ